MPQLGDLLIYLATICLALSGILYVLAWRGREQWLSLARLFFRTGAAVVIGALGILLYLILTHDFSVQYVASYSSTDLPLYFLISSLWGGQEGTFLLWISYVAIMALIMMATARRWETGNMVWINLFIISILAILIKKSPFETMTVFVTEGNGLNPLLQNYWMVIHPPIMFIGFAATVFPFAFAMTALVARRYGDWAEAARRWTVAAWGFLGVALVMGGYWAYETLGWGGFWAWDPVENSSLIPWIFLTAQIHALFVKRQRKGLLRFSIVMVMLSFWSVMYGTFLTRSGVLADFSVHSFVDLGINQFLIASLVGFVALGTFMIAFRWRDIHPEPSFSKVNSRTYMAALGIVILFVGGWLVLLGTSAPLLTRLSENPSAVGLGYYFSTMSPVAVALLILVALFPAFRWNKGLSKPILLVLGGAALIITATTLLVMGVTAQAIYLLLFGTAAAALVTNGVVLIQSWREGRLVPGYISHVGLALAIVGATASAGFEAKKTITLPAGQPVEYAGYNLTFTDMVDNAKGFNCHVNVDGSSNSFVAALAHEFPSNSEGVMKKPFVKSYLLYDLYLSPVSLEQPQRAQEPGTIYLEKEKSTDFDKYTITFHDFELSNHGDDSHGAMTATALVDITYEGRTEMVRPALQVVDGEVTPEAVTFDSSRGSISIAGVQPESGGVVLRLEGSFVPPAEPLQATLVVEVSEKPLIMLFWLGCIILFGGGFLSTIEFRRRRRMEEDYATALVESERAQSPAETL